jgi:uncharacterized protein (DUF58 family)
LRPTPRVIGALALFAILEWYAATSEVPWLFLLACWVFVLLAAAAVYAAWNRRGVTLHLTVRNSRPATGSPSEDLPEHVLRRGPFPPPVFEGDGLSLEITFHTRRGARGPVWCYGYVGEKRLGAGTGIVPKDGWSRLRTLSGLRRGPVGATRWTLGTSDPLGFFQGFRPAADREVALVLPRFASLAGRRRSRELEASLAAERAGSGNELFGIRPYRPGDSLRRIHWRSSARHGELVVREYEPPGLQTLRVVLDPSPSTTEVADQIARIAASEAWDCLRQGGRVVVSAPGLESIQSRNLWDVLEWLARYPKPFVPSGAWRHLPTSGEEVVVITAGANADLPAKADRVWVIGDGEVDLDGDVERVGTAWPL